MWSFGGPPGKKYGKLSSCNFDGEINSEETLKNGFKSYYLRGYLLAGLALASSQLKKAKLIALKLPT